MNEQPTEMHLRLAEADTMAVETDAPDPGGGIPYDAGLQADLLEHGPQALKDYGMIVVRNVADSSRYNAAVWYALAQEPILHYELRDGCVIITDPAAA